MTHNHADSSRTRRDLLFIIIIAVEVLAATAAAKIKATQIWHPWWWWWCWVCDGVNDGCVALSQGRGRFELFKLFFALKK